MQYEVLCKHGRTLLTSAFVHYRLQFGQSVSQMKAVNKSFQCFIRDEGKVPHIRIAEDVSTINVVDIHGKQQYNESELLRWLSESVWFPTNLLPSEKLHWTAIADSSAKLTFNYNGLSLFYIINFNDNGEIVQMETKHYMDEKRLEIWIIKPDKYVEINGVISQQKRKFFGD